MARSRRPYRALKPGGALLVATDPFFFTRRAQIVALSARHTVPAVYDSLDYANAGGLISYGTDIENLWEQAGVTIGRLQRRKARRSAGRAADEIHSGHQCQNRQDARA